MKVHMTDSAIVVLHDGNQKYLEKCLTQARKISDKVKFIGKSENFKSDLSPEALLSAQKNINIFLKCYKHMSSNPKWIEIACFKRFFYAYEYAKSNLLTDIWIIDSDVLIFTDLMQLSEGCEWLYSYDAALSIPKQDYDSYDWAASPHTSWWSIQGLKSFTEFIIDTYTNRIEVLEKKFNYSRVDGSHGGICDMTLLYLWSINHKVFNLAEHIVEGYYIDHNINQKRIHNNQDAKMSYGIKKIIIDNKFVKITTIDESEIKVGSLHFQGRAKNLMLFFGPGIYNKIMFILAFMKLKMYRILKVF